MTNMSNHRMVLPESVLVVLVSTLAGGLDRGGPVIVNASTLNDTADRSTNSSRIFSPGNGSCAVGARWAECRALDQDIKPVHLGLPWFITLGTIVILSMPTVLLRSRRKQSGLRVVACNLLQFLGLLACASVISDHPSICFTLTLHSCVRLLVQLEISDSLVGGNSWWTLRYAVVWILLCLQLCFGPSISVVQWPSTPTSALPCAYLAHLVGYIVPDMALASLRWLIVMFNCVKTRED